MRLKVDVTLRAKIVTSGSNILHDGRDLCGPTLWQKRGRLSAVLAGRHKTVSIHG